MKYFIASLSFLACMVVAYRINAQAKQDKYGNEYFDGGWVASPTPEVPKSPYAQHAPLILLKYDNNGILMGNNCVREETLKMGFEYLVLCEKDVRWSNKVWIWFYNLGSHVELTFKNGFGWKSRLKKKIAECKRNSGDFIW